MAMCARDLGGTKVKGQQALLNHTLNDLTFQGLKCSSLGSFLQCNFIINISSSISNSSNILRTFSYILHVV